MTGRAKPEFKDVKQAERIMGVVREPSNSDR